MVDRSKDVPSSLVLKRTGWFISALSLAGLVFIKPLSAKVFPHAGLFDPAAVLIILFLAGIRLERAVAFFRLANIRRVIRVKTGFTFVFCVFCAILLLAAGWFFPPPDLAAYGIERPAPGEAGYSEPPVFLPGREITLTVAPSARRLHKESMDGLWKADDLTAELTVEGVSSAFALTDAVTEDSGEFWEGSEGERDVRYYRRAVAALNPPPLSNTPFFPWIKFNVPSDPSLKGKTGMIRVRMTITYPYLLSQDRYDIARFKLDEQVPLKVASDAEYRAYGEYLSAVMNGDMFRKIRLYALIIFCAFAILIRMFARF